MPSPVARQSAGSVSISVINNAGVKVQAQQVIDGRGNRGDADSLDEAKSEFKEAWERFYASLTQRVAQSHQRRKSKCPIMRHQILNVQKLNSRSRLAITP